MVKPPTAGPKIDAICQVELLQEQGRRREDEVRLANDLERNVDIVGHETRRNGALELHDQVPVTGDKLFITRMGTLLPPPFAMVEEGFGEGFPGDGDLFTTVDIGNTAIIDGVVYSPADLGTIAAHKTLTIHRTLTLTVTTAVYDYAAHTRPLPYV